MRIQDSKGEEGAGSPPPPSRFKNVFVDNSQNWFDFSDHTINKDPESGPKFLPENCHIKFRKVINIGA